MIQRQKKYLKTFHYQIRVLRDGFHPVFHNLREFKLKETPIGKSLPEQHKSSGKTLIFLCKDSMAICMGMHASQNKGEKIVEKQVITMMNRKRDYSLQII